MWLLIVKLMSPDALVARPKNPASVDTPHDIRQGHPPAVPERRALNPFYFGDPS